VTPLRLFGGHYTRDCYQLHTQTACHDTDFKKRGCMSAGLREIPNLRRKKIAPERPAVSEITDTAGSALADQMQLK
jgi:hypothetical protein